MNTQDVDEKLRPATREAAAAKHEAIAEITGGMVSWAVLALDRAFLGAICELRVRPLLTCSGLRPDLAPITGPLGPSATRPGIGAV